MGGSTIGVTLFARIAWDSAHPGFTYGQSLADQKAICRVSEITSKKWSMTQVALAWLNKWTTAAVVGFSKVPRTEVALGSTGKCLSDEEDADVEEPYVAKDVEGYC